MPRKKATPPAPPPVDTTPPLPPMKDGPWDAAWSKLAAEAAPPKPPPGPDAPAAPATRPLPPKAVDVVDAEAGAEVHRQIVEAVAAIRAGTAPTPMEVLQARMLRPDAVPPASAAAAIALLPYVHPRINPVIYLPPEGDVHVAAQREQAAAHTAELLRRIEQKLRSGVKTIEAVPIKTNGSAPH